MSARGALGAATAHPRLLTWVFARVMLANFGYFLSLGVMNIALPRFIEGPLGSTDVGVGLGVGSFTVTALLLRPFSGRFGDRRGRQLPIAIGAVLHTVAVAGMILSSSLVHVVALRLLTGVAEALFFVGVSTAAQDLAPDHRRGEAASVFSLSLFVALAIGPVAGETVLDRFGYDAVWGLAAGAAAFGAILAITIPDTRVDPSADGKPGPLIHPASLRPGLILGCAIWGLAAFGPFVPLYALELGMSGARMVLLANSLTILAVRSIGARIPDQLGPLRTARFALICNPCGLAVMGLWQDVPGLFVGAIVLGIGQALAFPALMTIAVNSAPASERGSVMGTFTAFFDLSFGGGAIVLGAVAHAVGYNGAFLTAMGVASIGLMVLLAAPPKVPVGTLRSSPVLAIEPPGE
ncbi:MAG: MFS transporter [Actinomycetota bacterium]